MSVLSELFSQIMLSTQLNNFLLRNTTLMLSDHMKATTLLHITPQINSAMSESVSLLMDLYGDPNVKDVIHFVSKE